MSYAYDVIVYGPLFCDLVFTGLPSMPQLGREAYAEDLVVALGGSAIVAIGLHRQGARVGLAADLGSDPLGRLCAELIAAEGLDTALLRRHAGPLPQVTVALAFPEDRAFVTRLAKPDRPARPREILRDHPARHLHLSSFQALFDAPDAPAAAHDAGATVSLDPGWDEVALRDPRLHAALGELDLFLPSRSELYAVAGTDDPEAALERVAAAMGGGTVVRKDGAAGAVALSAAARERVAAVPVEAVDPTGAGDAFDAGFLFAYTRGEPLAAALRRGAVCGALATTRPGGATAAPDDEEIRAWLSRSPS